MRILALCKRQYTGQDLLDDRYGRLYEIPDALASRGHEVHGLTISYRHRGQTQLLTSAGVRWKSLNLLPWGMSTARLAAALPTVDVIWAGSDIPICLSGIALGRRYRIPVVLDLYDNYESFGLSRLPGLKRRFRQACADAQGITAVTHTLAAHIQSFHDIHLPIRVVGNGVNTEVFFPRDKSASREALGLPKHARIIGCAGALNDSRGISDLFEAFMMLAEQDPDLHLAIAGPRDSTVGRYAHPRIIDLGELEWKEVPCFISTLDVSVVCNRDSEFGRFCYPLKLIESQCCQIPIVATAVGEVPRLLHNETETLYPPGDFKALAMRVKRLLEHPPRSPARNQPPRQWDGLAIDVESALSDALNGSRGSLQGHRPTVSPR